MLHEFIITIPYPNAEEITEKLNGAGIYHTYYESPIEVIKTQNGYGIEEKTNEEIEFKIYASDYEFDQLPERFFTLIEETLAITKNQIQHSCSEETNWEQSYHFEDIDLGNGWVIKYLHSNERYEGKNMIMFEPLAAFGTGLHETTQDCLSLILKRDLSAKEILDLGTGSGMLTIGASLKGAKRVVAIDYEPIDRELYHNAQLNALTNELEVIQADLIDGDYTITDRYDLIIINIGGDETINIIRKHDLLNKSNEFIISGLVEWHIDPIIDMFSTKGFIIKEKLQTNEWVTIHFSVA